MKKIYIFFAALMLITSCEDPIEVTLKDAEDQIVVDAWLNNMSERQEIKISSTLPYFENQFTPGIENPVVTVSNSRNETFEFIHLENGLYINDLTNGQTIGDIGDSFTLNIQIEQETYTSSTVMNPVPPIDSITQEFRENEIFTDDGIYCEFFARDIIGLGNTYWIKSYKNGNYLNRAEEINIAYDAGFDSGGEVDGLIFIFPIRDLVNEISDDGLPIAWQSGDEIRVEIHSVANDSWAFLELMRDQLINSRSGIFAEPLANTKGNIVHSSGSDEVLGVFNVAAISLLEQIIE